MVVAGTMGCLLFTNPMCPGVPNSKDGTGLARLCPENSEVGGKRGLHNVCCCWVGNHNGSNPNVIRFTLISSLKNSGFSLLLKLEVGTTSFVLKKLIRCNRASE